MFSTYMESVKKILFTLGILFIYKSAMLITLPGVNFNLLKGVVTNNSFFKTLDFFLGGGIERCSIIALGIMPYLSASMLVQFLSSNSGIQYFQEIKRDKEMGNVKLNSWTKYITGILAVINGFMVAYNIFHVYNNGAPIVYMDKISFYALSVLILTAGSFLAVWVANQISKRGIGNGVSVLIFFNVISQTGNSLTTLFKMIWNGQVKYLHLFYIVMFFLVVTIFTIAVESSYKYIDVYFPGMEGETSMKQRLPIKLNNSGVMPSVLTSSFVEFPHLIFSFLRKIFYVESLQKIANYTSKGGPLYYVTFAILIFIMNIVHSSISFNTKEIASQLEEHNIFVKGVQQGKSTRDYIDSLINKINIISGIYLILLCGVSEFVCDKINVLIGANVLNFTGTTVLIVVQISQLILKGVSNFDYQKVFNSIY